MSVTHRATGTWAELVADGTVAIPATPQAGDRMYLFAGWKDFSVTATVANWTELVEFADGAVSAGNGTGSVKVACWYRDWQPGDADPTIDFSASPDNACAVITVMQKGADDVWLTPVARTAAMTNWTTTSQSVAASATVDVPGDSVVMGLIRLRDDSAVMTRPTNGIDDAGGLVTWNGNYVESPATHHSTTTGFDGAADLGYRLVTTGAAGTTLRMTGTISAAETGAALWVVQGVSVLVTPAAASLITSTFVPLLKLVITPAVAVLTITSFAPQLRETATPANAALTVTTFAVQVDQRVTPPRATLTITSFAPRLQETVTPASTGLSVITFAPVLQERLTPGATPLTLTTFAPLIIQNILITVPSASLTITTLAPHVKPFRIVYLDPGGDAVQAPGYFAVVNGPEMVEFDSTQKVVGVGSWKFDSSTSASVANVITGVLGQSRRVSCYFRYDSLPDEFAEHSEFLSSFSSIYSGGGFVDIGDLQADDGAYATATPAKNAGQGSRCIPLGGLVGSLNAIIDSVKIIYERKYDTDTSIGISRVKWVVNGVEGPDHDNTDMPLTDTVVEVDVTNDRFWEPQDLGDGFEVVVEARRGDTDTAHTQSWDYAKVEVVYHLGTIVLAGMDGSNHTLFDIALNPKGDRSVFRFTDGDGNSFDGISALLVDTWNRLSVSYVLHAADNLDVKVYVNGIEELSIEQASTGGFSPLFTLLYGWVTSPGVDHLCWFDQLYIDDGDDLTDTVFGPEFRPPLCTAKLSGTVHEDEWDTTTGTGAVNERPLSETNLRRHNAATSARQTYTLQTAAVGDIDISAETLLGYMVWAWAKMQIADDDFFLVANGVEVNRTSQIEATPSLLKHAVSSSTYPSNAAGVGARTNEEGVDTYLYECGAVVAYLGPVENVPLLEFQLLEEDSITPASDDVSGEDPETYVIHSEVAESPGATVTTTIYATDSAGTPHQQAVIESNGGEESGRVVIAAPGEEVSVSVEVTGADAEVGLVRTLNVD